jgi:hypothetical protein
MHFSCYCRAFTYTIRIRIADNLKGESVCPGKAGFFNFTAGGTHYRFRPFGFRCRPFAPLVAVGRRLWTYRLLATVISSGIASSVSTAAASCISAGTAARATSGVSTGIAASTTALFADTAAGCAVIARCNCKNKENEEGYY